MRKNNKNLKFIYTIYKKKPKYIITIKNIFRKDLSIFYNFHITIFLIKKQKNIFQN